MKITDVVESINYDQFLLEMANLTKRMTGLPMNIYVSTKDSVHDRHGPRIKVMTTYGDRFDKNSLTSVSIAKMPVDFYGKLTQNDFAQIVAFIQRNYEPLLAFWNNEIDIGQLLNALRLEDE
jgi:hypothetical protein